MRLFGTNNRSDRICKYFIMVVSIVETFLSEYVPKIILTKYSEKWSVHLLFFKGELFSIWTI